MSAILTFVDQYLPGYKSGGPVRTMAAIVERLGTELEFRIVTRDRDWTDTVPYSDVRVDAWQRVGNADVFYASPSSLRAGALRRLAHDVPHGAIYLNSFFSPTFTVPLVALRALRLTRRVPTIVAPRGELADSALAIRSGKKRPYLALARATGLYSRVIWQASSEYEAADIRRRVGRRGRALDMMVAPDLMSAAPVEAMRATPKEAGSLRVIFLSRVSRIKNLDSAIAMLRTLGAPAQLDVYGPLEDQDYWEECRRAIDALPSAVSVTYHGLAQPEQVPALMANHDVLLLPTRGENFGHVIPEALSAGCPVLISDRTAFRSLSTLGVGWDVDLDDFAGFVARLHELRAMDEATHAKLRAAARVYGARLRNDPTTVEQNRALFRYALASEP